MATYQLHECPKCGRAHRSKPDKCWQCLLAEKPKMKFTCAGCAGEFEVKTSVIPSRCTSCASKVSVVAKKAYGKVARAIRYGNLPPPNELACVDCGENAECYDHREYLKPLDVVPVCRLCNKKRGPAVDLAGVVMSHSQKLGAGDTAKAA